MRARSRAASFPFSAPRGSDAGGARTRPVRGLVQGVYFRAETRARARSLGLTGWVGNRTDGQVEAVFEGERERVESMVDWCRHGPPGAVVHEVDDGLGGARRRVRLPHRRVSEGEPSRAFSPLICVHGTADGHRAPPPTGFAAGVASDALPCASGATGSSSGSSASSAPPATPSTSPSTRLLVHVGRHPLPRGGGRLVRRRGDATTTRGTGSGRSAGQRGHIAYPGRALPRRLARSARRRTSPSSRCS